MRDAAHQATVDEVRRLVAASAPELEEVSDPLSLHLPRLLWHASCRPGEGTHVVTSKDFVTASYGKDRNFRQHPAAVLDARTGRPYLAACSEHGTRVGLVHTSRP
jgi:hypothetical protein